MTTQEIHDIIANKLAEKLKDKNTVAYDIGRSFTDWFQNLVTSRIQSRLAQAQPEPAPGEPPAEPPEGEPVAA